MADTVKPPPLFSIPIPILVLTGKHESGKTLMGLTIAPKQTCHYDLELSGLSYESLGMERVSVPDEMRKLYPHGYRPRQLYEWWINDVRTRVTPGKHRVVFIDPATEIEDGLVEWVRENPAHFAATKTQYEKMSGIMWGHVKSHWKSLLTDLASRCEMVVIAVHMASVWSGDRPTGKLKPKGKETLYELASLYLLLQREIDATGKKPDKPSAVVLKSRLAHMVINPATQELDPQPILPPRLPICTPNAIREYIAKPVDYAKLKKEHLVHEAAMTEEEKAEMALATAQARADTARAELANTELLARVRGIDASQAATAQAQTLAHQTVADSDKHSVPVAAAMPSVPTGQNGAPAVPNTLPGTPKTTEPQVAELRRLKEALGLSQEAWAGALAKRGVATARDLPSEGDPEKSAAGLIAKLRVMLDVRQAAAGTPPDAAVPPDGGQAEAAVKS